MYTNLMFLSENNNEKLVRVHPYELALLLKSYPENSCYSILETVWTKQGLVEDYFNEDEQTWYAGFAMPPTSWLVAQIRRDYGADPIWIKVPESLMGLVETVRQSPKRRWRLQGKWRKINNRFHRPWWM